MCLSWLLSLFSIDGIQVSGIVDGGGGHKLVNALTQLFVFRF